MFNANKIKISINTIYLAFVLSIALIIVRSTNSPLVHIAVLWIVAIISSMTCNFNIVHPYCWFPLSFSLYSSAYAIMYYVEPGISLGYSQDNTWIPLLAMSAFLMTVGGKKIEIDLDTVSQRAKSETSVYIIKLLSYILVAFLGVAVLYLAGTSFSNKKDLLASRNIIFLGGAYAARYLSFYSIPCLFFLERKDNRKLVFYTILLSTPILLFSLFTGERDAIFRQLLVVIITLFAMKLLKHKHILFIVPAGIVGMMLMTYYKYYFVNGSVASYYSLQSGNVLYNFLNTDFSAAGMNLQVLLNHPSTKSFAGYSTIMTDIISPLFPGNTFLNLGDWFNKTYYANSYSRAFTLSGEGYAIGGYLGVVVLFVIIGIIIRIMYEKANTNMWWYSLYVYLIPTTITAFRSTLITVSTALIRITLVAIVIVLLCKNLLTKQRPNSFTHPF